MAKEVSRTASIVEAELSGAKRESDEAESAIEALDGQREALVLKGAYEQVVELEKKIDLQRLRLEGASKRTRLLAEELNDVRQNDNFAVLTARAAEMRADKQRGSLLKELNAALVQTANVLSKIQQHNTEAGEINRALPEGAEFIPVLDIRIAGNPHRHSLIDWLNRDVFPIRELPDPPVVQWPGRAGYPQAVQSVFAKLDEEKRAAFAAAHPRRVFDSGPGLLAVGYSPLLRPNSENSNS